MRVRLVTSNIAKVTMRRIYARGIVEHRLVYGRGRSAQVVNCVVMLKTNDKHRTRRNNPPPFLG